jgi:hypothetical protein
VTIASIAEGNEVSGLTVHGRFAAVLIVPDLRV